MKIRVNEDRKIVLEDVFEPVEFVSSNGERLIVCMKDGGFEVDVENTSIKRPEGTQLFSSYSIQGGVINLLSVDIKGG